MVSTNIGQQLAEIEKLLLKPNQSKHLVSMFSMIEDEMRQQFQRNMTEAQNLFNNINNKFDKAVLLLPNKILQTKVKDFDGDISFFENIIDQQEFSDIPVSYVSVEIVPKDLTNSNTTNDEQINSTNSNRQVLKQTNNRSKNDLTNISIAQRTLYSSAKKNHQSQNNKTTTTNYSIMTNYNNNNNNGTIDSGNGSNGSTMDSAVKSKIFSNSSTKKAPNSSTKKASKLIQTTTTDSTVTTTFLQPMPPNGGLELSLNIKNKPVRLFRKDDRARVMFFSTNGSPLVVNSNVHKHLQDQTDKVLSKLK